MDVAVSMPGNLTYDCDCQLDIDSIYVLIGLVAFSSASFGAFLLSSAQTLHRRGGCDSFNKIIGWTGKEKAKYSNPEEAAYEIESMPFAQLSSLSKNRAEAEGWFALDPKGPAFSAAFMAEISAEAETAHSIGKQLDSMDEEYMKLLRRLSLCRSSADMADFIEIAGPRRAAFNQLIGECYYDKRA